MMKTFLVNLILSLNSEFNNQCSLLIMSSVLNSSALLDEAVNLMINANMPLITRDTHFVDVTIPFSFSMPVVNTYAM